MTRNVRIEDVCPGGYIPEEHIKDMDIDGIDVSIVYPTIGLQLYSGVPDSELLSSMFRTYNDWVGEFCSAFPKRLKGIAVLNVDDLQEAVKELERCAKLDFAGGYDHRLSCRGTISFQRPDAVSPPQMPCVLNSKGQF